MRCVLLVAIVLLSSTNWSQAADPTTSNVVKTLLEKGWGKTAEARKFPDYPSLNDPPLNTNPSVQAARWLVLMHQNRYPESLVNLEIFSKTKPSDDLHLAGLRATAWLYTITKEYPKALIQADQLAQAANPNPPSMDLATVESQNEAIVFLGSLAGFLEGPCEKSADQARAKFEERVLQHLDEPRKKVFADAKADALAKFNKLTAELADAKSKSQQTAEEERKKALADLDGDLQKLSQEETKLQNQKMEVKATFDKSIAALDRQDLPLQQNLLGLQGQITLANTNATQAQTTLQNLQLQLNNAKDAPTRQKLQNDIMQANNNLQTARTLLDQFNNQAAVIIRQRKMIEQQRIAADRSGTLETNKIDKQLQGLDSDKKKIDRKIADLKKAKLGPPAKVLALETEVRALTTYSEFPLQVLRDRWLKQVQ